jgi:hypothetical protein
MRVTYLSKATKKLMKAGSGKLSPPSSLKVIRLSNSKIKGAGLLASPEEAGPLHASLYELFRDLGSGRPPPAESIV